MDFGGLRIAFDPRVLRPRPWTVAQAEWAADILRDAPPGPVLDLCAGVGQIGLLAVRLAGRTLVAVDADPAACAYARRNAADAGLRVDVREGPMEEVLARGESFIVVIADPPWVPSSETDDHPEDPLEAIDGGPDGLAVARRCLHVLGQHLMPGGSAVLQLADSSQIDELAPDLAAYAELRVSEVREFPDGALARLDRAHQVAER